MLVVDTPISTKPDCAQNFNILSFDKSTAHGKDLYAIALTGFTTQKKLWITYSDTVCGLSDVRVLISRIDLVRD